MRSMLCRPQVCYFPFQCAWCESPRKCGAESFFTKECSTKDARRFTCTCKLATMLLEERSAYVCPQSAGLAVVSYYMNGPGPPRLYQSALT